MWGSHRRDGRAARKCVSPGRVEIQALSTRGASAPCRGRQHTIKEIFYLLPKIVGYASTLAAIVLLVMLWRRTHIAGYAVLASLVLVGRAYRAWAIPDMATRWLGWQLYDAWFYTALALVAALAWWNIYIRTTRPRPGP